MEMKMNIDPGYEYEWVDKDDDVFYAEIRRQILLLTADDDDDDDSSFNRIIHADGARKLPGSNRAIGNLCSSLHNGSYFSSWESENTKAVPTWLANLWTKNGNGTGVFIPHVSKPKRRHRPGRKNREKAYRAVENRRS